MIHRTQRDHDQDQDLDPAGERGDTGPLSYVEDDPQAEKGDQQRDKPVHSGPTWRGTSRNKSKHDKRSGSGSNAS